MWQICTTIVCGLLGRTSDVLPGVWRGKCKVGNVEPGAGRGKRRIAPDKREVGLEFLQAARTLILVEARSEVLGFGVQEVTQVWRSFLCEGLQHRNRFCKVPCFSEGVGELGPQHEGKIGDAQV